jgi:hypothetical protein
VLGASALVEARQDVASRRVRHLLVALLLLAVGVAASALVRMALYTDAYGLTALRLHASALMLFLVVVMGWMGATVLRGARDRFVLGALALFVGTVFALDVANPDAIIARVNVSFGPKVDVAQLGDLSDDAMPTLAARAASLEGATKSEVCALIERRAQGARNFVDAQAPRAWNLSTARAAHAACANP